MRTSIDFACCPTPRFAVSAWDHDDTISAMIFLNGEPAIRMERYHGDATSNSATFRVERCAAEELARRLERLAADVRAAAAQRKESAV